MFKSAIKYLLLAAALMLAPSAASAAASYPFIKPDIASVEAMGAACGTTVAGVWVPNHGHYAWNGSSTATADGVNILQCTGVVTGRMIIDEGPLALASITAMQNLPGPIANMTVDVAGTQGGRFIATSVGLACTTDNGTKWPANDGTLICWERQYTGPVLPAYFGADTSVADNTTALGYWINSGFLDLACSGTYLTGPLTWTVANATVHNGEGVCTLKAMSGIAANVSILTLNAAHQTIDGVYFDMTNSTGDNSHAVLLGGTYDAVKNTNVTDPIGTAIFNNTAHNYIENITASGGQDVNTWLVESVSGGDYFHWKNVVGYGLSARLITLESNNYDRGEGAACYNNCVAETLYALNTSFSDFGDLIHSGNTSVTGDDQIVIDGLSTNDTVGHVTLAYGYGVGVNITAHAGYGAPTYITIASINSAYNGETCFQTNSNNTAYHPSRIEIASLMCMDPSQKGSGLFPGVQFTGSIFITVKGAIYLDDGKGTYSVQEVSDPLSGTTADYNTFAGTSTAGTSGYDSAWVGAHSVFDPISLAGNFQTISADADVIWKPGVYAWTINFTAAQTVDRNFTVNMTGAAPNTCVLIHDNSTGSHALIIKNATGGGLVTLTAGQSAAFQYDYTQTTSCH